MTSPPDWHVLDCSAIPRGFDGPCCSAQAWLASNWPPSSPPPSVWVALLCLDSAADRLGVSLTRDGARQICQDQNPDSPIAWNNGTGQNAYQLSHYRTEEHPILP